MSTISLIFIILACSTVHAQTIDTLIDVGGYQLHFHIVKGKGIPILFEAGGGEDATTWEKIIQPIANRTATTLITYDRAGFGKSTFDTTRHGILNGIIGLETGLRKLGYNGNIMLVAHSQGGLYAQLYASRHRDKVKAAVLIDVTTTCFYNSKRLAETQQMIRRQNTDKIKASAPGTYYQGADFSNNIEWMRKFPFPGTIPLTDFVSDHPPFHDSTDIKDWKRCHREFAAASANRTGILATGCGHFIFNDNPPLVIDAIVKAYFLYCSSDTFSIHSTTFPSRLSWIAICVMAVVGDAPCQCLSPGANHTTSPGRISSTGPPSRCTQPRPAITISVCPNGCVCQAVRAPGSNVTLAPAPRAGASV